MNQKSLNTGRLVFIGVIVMLILGALLVIIIKSKNPEVKWQDIVWNLFILAMGIVIVFLVIYLILLRLSNKNNEKEIVPTTIVQKIMRQELGKEYKLMMYPPSRDGYQRLVNKDDIEIRNGRLYVYKGTSIPYYKMDIFIKKLGEWRVYQVRVDEGEEFVRLNYNMWESCHDTHGTVDLEKKDYPLATPQSYGEKVLDAMSELKSEGEDVSGMERLLRSNPSEDEKEPQKTFAPTPNYSQPNKQEETGKTLNDYHEEDIDNYKEKNRND